MKILQIVRMKVVYRLTFLMREPFEIKSLASDVFLARINKHFNETCGPSIRKQPIVNEKLSLYLILWIF